MVYLKSAPYMAIIALNTHLLMLAEGGCVTAAVCLSVSKISRTSLNQF